MCCNVQLVLIMDEFLGKKYEMVKSEYFEELLIFLDIGFIERKVALKLRPILILNLNQDGTYCLHFTCAVAHADTVFTPGEDFDETKPGGIKVRGHIDIEGNKLVHRQVEPNGRTLTHLYEFCKDTMTITTTGENHPKGNKLEQVVKRYYELVT